MLEMLSNGKVSRAGGGAAAAGGHGAGAGADEKKPEPRYFRILVNKPARDGKKAETVNIRVPMTVVRGRAPARRVVPRHAGPRRRSSSRNGGEIDCRRWTYRDLEAMIKDIGEAHGRRRRRRGQAGADSLRVGGDTQVRDRSRF